MRGRLPGDRAERHGAGGGGQPGEPAHPGGRGADPVHVADEASQATQIASNEYAAGTVDYTTVVTTQVAEYLNDRETALAIRQDGLLAMWP